MGVDRTDYLMLCADVGYERFDWDKHTPEIEGAPYRRFDVVFDGMSGKYCLAGKIIATSDPYEGFEKAVTISPDMIDVDRVDLAAKISDAFDGATVTPDDLKIVLFTHFQ